MTSKLKLFFFTVLLATMGFACKSESGSDKEDRKISPKVKTSAQANSYHYSYSFKMSQPGSDELDSPGLSEMFLSEQAVRSESNFEVMGQKVNMTMLIKANEPKKVIMLKDENKSYSIINSDDLKMGGAITEKIDKMYNDSISVLGTEKMNGYDCTHIKIVTTVNAPESVKKMVGHDSSVQEYWVSEEVPGSSMFNSWIKSQPKIMRSTNSKVYEYGIPVKMISKDGDAVNMVMELEEAKGINQDKSLFEIPSGYTKKE